MSALSGVRVLDFGRVLSAPYATMILADLGADVVKVEHPEGGDDTRAFGPPFVGGISTYFLSINRGKRSIILDLKSAEGRSQARALALSADVLVENFRPGVMKRLGLGAEEMLTEHPGLIYCSLTGRGRDSDAPGYDLMTQGLSGVPSITGPVDGEPYKCGASIADLVAGLNLVQGLLAALYKRSVTGKGGVVDVSMMDGMRSLLTYHASAYLNAGVVPQRMGNGHPSIHPFRPYQVADGFLNVCVGNDSLFRKFADVLGHPEWADDGRFQSNPQRVEHRHQLNALISPVMLSRSREEWKVLFAEHGVPSDSVASIAEALADAELVFHPHPSELDQFISTLPLPFGIDDDPRSADRRAPRLGEHTSEVLKEWLAER